MPILFKTGKKCALIRHSGAYKLKEKSTPIFRIYFFCIFEFAPRCLGFEGKGLVRPPQDPKSPIFGAWSQEKFVPSMQWPGANDSVYATLPGGEGMLYVVKVLKCARAR